MNVSVGELDADAVKALVGGKYRIGRLLGRGGMGVVWAATTLEGEEVALKFLDNPTNDPSVVLRFRREADALLRLTSDHVCGVYGLETSNTGMPYLVMELLNGEALSELLDHDVLDIETAAEFVLQACVGVAEAHRCGIVHRDLKPSNLFLARRATGGPIVKVLDFGVARILTADPTDVTLERLTRTNMVLGSLGYCSPEQLTDPDSVDERSDIWSLGVVLYRLATRRLPFPGQTEIDIARKILDKAPEPLVISSDTYVKVVMRCLQKSPGDRYQDINSLVQDLVACAGQRGASTPRTDRGAAPTPPGRPTRSATEPPTSSASVVRTSAAVQPRETTQISTTHRRSVGELLPRLSGARRVPFALALLLVVSGVAIIGLVGIGRDDSEVSGPEVFEATRSINLLQAQYRREQAAVDAGAVADSRPAADAPVADARGPDARATDARAADARAADARMVVDARVRVVADAAADAPSDSQAGPRFVCGFSIPEPGGNDQAGHFPLKAKDDSSAEAECASLCDPYSGRKNCEVLK